MTTERAPRWREAVVAFDTIRKGVAYMLSAMYQSRIS